MINIKECTFSLNNEAFIDVSVSYFLSEAENIVTSVKPKISSLRK